MADLLTQDPHQLLAIVGANVRRVRINKGWSVEWLAIQCDCTDEFIADIEEGRSPDVAFSLVARIALVLNYELSALSLRGGRETS